MEGELHLVQISPSVPWASAEAGRAVEHEYLGNDEEEISMKYMLTWIMVYASCIDVALNAARKVASELGFESEGRKTEYYADFASDEFGSALRRRWGPIPPVLQVSTKRFPTDDKRGLEYANYAMERNRIKFWENLKKIRHLMDKNTVDELFDEDNTLEDILIDGEIHTISPGFFRIYCEGLTGCSPTRYVHLYDYRGRTVPTRCELQCILEELDSDPCFEDLSEEEDSDCDPNIRNQPLWIVPFEMRY